VRTAHSVEQGIRDAVSETETDLLLLTWRPSRRPVSAIGTIERLVASPPCDIATVKEGESQDVNTVLVPARGGPHAQLALRVAEALAARHGAVLTLLHVVSPRWDVRRREEETRFYRAVRDSVRYGNVREAEIEGESVERVLLEQGAAHDLVVMGAAARDQRSSYLFGRLPETLAQRLDSTVIIVKTREPVTSSTFGLERETLALPEHRNLSEMVDRWFAENTFHSHEFRNLRYLIDLKERQGRTISVVLPTLNEEKTVGPIIETIKRRLVERYPLLDELVVIDSNSGDRTVEIAESLGVPVYRHPDVLPEHGSFVGKGEALWKSLSVTRGDIIAWIDSDITDIHPKFVYGLVGPLLTEPRLGFVKGFYRRPLNLGGQLLTTGGGRVTELTARPLINLFYPSLSGLVQPLAGEMAGRRDVLEAVPFFTGYGVETGLLIDILERFGLPSIGQTDLENRVHRNQTLLSLSKMAFAIVQVVMKRLSDQGRIDVREDLSTSMKLIHYSPAELFLEVKEIAEQERPPISTLPEYCDLFGTRERAVIST
jgi:glucosyl-3-phosphoglycerate synthase